MSKLPLGSTARTSRLWPPRVRSANSAAFSGGSRAVVPRCSGHGGRVERALVGRVGLVRGERERRGAAARGGRRAELDGRVRGVGVHDGPGVDGRGLFDHVVLVGALDLELVLAGRQVVDRVGGAARHRVEAVERAAEGHVLLVRLELEGRAALGGLRGRPGQDRGRRRADHGPVVLCGGPVGVRRVGQVDRAHEQRVRAGLQAGEVGGVVALVEGSPPSSAHS